MNDVKFINVENLSKLINIMQLIIEYSLYCQESQSRIIQSLNKKHKHEILSKHKFEKKYLSMKENIKGYENQLSYLKSVVGHDESESNNFITDNKDKYSKAVSVDMIQSILQSEKDTRENMMSTIEKQKQSFIQEMGKIMSYYMNKEDSIEKLTQSASQMQLQSSFNILAQKLENLLTRQSLTLYPSICEKCRLQEEDNRRNSDSLQQKISHAQLKAEVDFKQNEIDRLVLKLKQHEIDSEKKITELQSSYQSQINRYNQVACALPKAKLVAIRLLSKIYTQGNYLLLIRCP
jgi:hypothetical protein